MVNIPTFLIVFNFLSTSGSPVRSILTLLTTGVLVVSLSSPSPSSFCLAFFASLFFLFFRAALDGALAPPNTLNYYRKFNQKIGKYLPTLWGCSSSSCNLKCTTGLLRADGGL